MAQNTDLKNRAIEAIAQSLCRSNPNYRIWHMPGDTPRKWKSPGGAVYHTSELPPESAEVLRNDARAVLAAAAVLEGTPRSEDITPYIKLMFPGPRPPKDLSR